MSPINENRTKITKEETDQPTSNPIISPGARNLLVVLVVLIIIGVVGYLIIKARSKNNQNPTADQIHNSFNPASSTSPSFIPPIPDGGIGSSSSPQFSGGPKTSEPKTVSPTTPQPQIQPITPRQTTPSAPAGPVVYQNPVLGFALTIPGNWIVNDQQSPDHIVFFDRNTGQIVGYMEIYENSPYDNLDTLAQTLQDSPEVNNIIQVSVAGLPAILYSAAPGFTGGVAAIFNNRVYYFHGALADPNILSSFKFL
jgi:hypothetical protein